MRVVLNRLPETARDIAAEPLDEPARVVALGIAALCHYEEDREAALSMLEALRGPKGISELDRQFLADRFCDGRCYVARSFFAGATPENGYEPDTPYVIDVEEGPYSHVNEGYVQLFIRSGGADSPRPVSLRQKASTGQWFLVDDFGFLAGIRPPAEDDPWA